MLEETHFKHKVMQFVGQTIYIIYTLSDRYSADVFDNRKSIPTYLSLNNRLAIITPFDKKKKKTTQEYGGNENHYNNC